MTPESWLSNHSLLPDPAAARRLREASESGTRLGVVLLAHDAATTIGRHLLLLRHGWPGGTAPWTEILVADLGSADSTLDIARTHGAEILAEPDRPARTAAMGDGLAQALAKTESDILVVVPASLVRIEIEAVAALMAAMLDHPAARIAMGAESAQGCEISRYSLRPLLSALCPPLSVLSDPATPFLAIRPKDVKALPLARTNGYEAALAVDCWHLHGLESLLQVLTGPLYWSEAADPRQNSTHAFHAQLAALESLRRAGNLQVPGEFGHILPTPVEWTPEGPRLVSRLEVFDWKEDETALKLKAWFKEDS